MSQHFHFTRNRFMFCEFVATINTLSAGIFNCRIVLYMQNAMNAYLVLWYYDNTLNTFFTSTFAINFPFFIFPLCNHFLLTLFSISPLFGRLNVWQKFQYLNIPSNSMLVGQGFRDRRLGWDIMLNILRNCMFKCMQQINRFCVRLMNTFSI